MLMHLLYIVAFSVLAFLAIGNLVRNLITLGTESQRGSFSMPPSRVEKPRVTLHPEMLDAQGKVMSEPLLVMRSLSVEDARERLDALYNASPSGSDPEA